MTAARANSCLAAQRETSCGGSLWTSTGAKASHRWDLNTHPRKTTAKQARQTHKDTGLVEHRTPQWWVPYNDTAHSERHGHTMSHALHQTQINDTNTEATHTTKLHDQQKTE